MTDDKNLPASIPANSIAPQVKSGGLIGRGLSAVRQSLAVSDQQEAERLFITGCRFYYGRDNTPKDHDKARHYLTAAARLNHAEAQYELWGLLGPYGECKEWQEAVGWLKSSVSLGFGPAQYTLADIVSDNSASLEVHLRIVEPYLNKRDYDPLHLYQQGIAWLEAKANSGDLKYQFLLGLYFDDPHSPMYNPAEAMQWIKVVAQDDGVLGRAARSSLRRMQNAS